MRTFTRWLTVAAVAAALTMTGCRERSREDNSGGMGGSGDNKGALDNQGTGGSGKPVQGKDAGTVR